MQMVSENRIASYRNVQRDVTTWTGWQRWPPHKPACTEQKRCFYKDSSLTRVLIFVVNKIKIMFECTKRRHIFNISR